MTDLVNTDHFQLVVDGHEDFSCQHNGNNNGDHLHDELCAHLIDFGRGAKDRIGRHEAGHQRQCDRECAQLSIASQETHCWTHCYGSSTRRIRQ